LATSLNYLFINTSTPGYTSQQWAFGDGTGSMEPNPVHAYASPGIYNACLTIWDSLGNCQSTYCMEIYAGEVMGDFTLSGNVIAGNTLADQGTVWLIGANNYYFAETMIDSAGTYNFVGIPAGSYYIYAMLTPGSSNFFDYLPTYYTSSLNWQGATIVATSEPNGWYPISLVSSVSFTPGNASISGTINWGGTFKSGNPAANVEIILFNSTGLPIAYTFSDADGLFEFSNLPYGEYTIHAEMTGKITETVVVMLADNSTSVTINFVVNGTAISVLGQNEAGLPALEAGNPYPNPVGETLWLELNSSTTGKLKAEIIDLQGRIIISESITTSNGGNRISVATGDLIKGIYLLRISSEGKAPVQRKFIK
jgi:PKD repeat protein